MNTSGEVADLMVKEGLQITEEVVKLTGLGAKNLAAIVIALLKEDNKMQGKTNLKHLLKSDKPLCILQIKEDDISKFNTEANKYGVLFTAVKDTTNNSGLCDIIAKQDDVTKLNYIMERMGYAAPDKEIEPEPDPEKNVLTRARENLSDNGSMKYGDTDRTDNRTKVSVKKKVEEIKVRQAKVRASKEPERKYTHTNSAPKRKRLKKKGKGR